MNYSFSNTYSLKWELDFAPNYKFTDDGICINTKTGRRIKKTLCGGSAGYCILGKFTTAMKLRKHLRKIQEIETPF